MSDIEKKFNAEDFLTRSTGLNVTIDLPIEIGLWLACRYLSLREVVNLTRVSSVVRRLVCGIEYLEDGKGVICKTFDPGIIQAAEQYLRLDASNGPSVGFPCPLISMITCRRLLRAPVPVRKMWMRRAVNVERLNVIVDQRGITGIVPHLLAHILAANHRTLTSITVEWHAVAARNKCAQIDQLPDWWKVDKPAAAVTTIQDAIENTSPTVLSPSMSPAASPMSSPELLPAPSPTGSRMRSPSPSCLRFDRMYDSQDSSVSSNVSMSRLVDFDSDEAEENVAFKLTIKEFSPDLSPGNENDNAPDKQCSLDFSRTYGGDYIPHFVFESAENVELIFHNPAAIRFFAGCYFPACRRFQIHEKHPDYEAFVEPDTEVTEEHTENLEFDSVEPTQSQSSDTQTATTADTSGTTAKPQITLTPASGPESGVAAMKKDAKSVFNILTRLIRGMSKLEKAYVELGPKHPRRYKSKALVDDAREIMRSLVSCRHINSVTCRWPHILAEELRSLRPEDRPPLQKVRVETASLLLSAFPLHILDEMPHCLWESKRVYVHFEPADLESLDMQTTATSIRRFLCLQEECLEHLTLGMLPQALLDVLSQKGAAISFPRIKEVDIETLDQDLYRRVDCFLRHCNMKRSSCAQPPIRLYISTNAPERLLTRFEAFYLEVTSKSTIRNICDSYDCRSRLHGIVGHIQSIKVASQLLSEISFFKKPPLKFLEVWIDYPSTRHLAAIEKLYPLLKKYSSIKEVRIFVRFYPLFLGQSEIFSSRSPESHLLRRILRVVGFVRFQEAEYDISKAEKRRAFVFQRETQIFNTNINAFTGTF